jgi:hypothetical protein
MCFTKEQALEIGSYFSVCELEDSGDYYLWVQK